MVKADIGLVGLAVMGENLAVNMESKGFRVAVYNRSPKKVELFMQGRARGKHMTGCTSLRELAEALKRPRKIMLMIRAGDAVDQMIRQLEPFLDAGDIIIDGGNSYFRDTMRRMEELNQKGILLIGTGVSGGEEGALKGPCLMPGGNREAWEALEPIFKKISARAGDHVPCCAWIGDNGAGHFVKMVHNGIEYGDMQLICEAYQLMRDGLGMGNDEMHEIFSRWNHTELDSYLIQITGDILGYRDESGKAVVDQILDVAGQKGTGKWTCGTALEEGVPLTLISEAVFARCIAAMKPERLEAEAVYGGNRKLIQEEQDGFVEKIRKALYASKIISYAQGYSLMRTASQKYNWKLDFGSIALIWRGGCIIRSTFLDRIKEAYDRSPDLANLLLDPFFQHEIRECLTGWREVVAKAVSNGIPVPAMSSALSYFDGYRCGVSSANLLQAQRDYFGSHTYERIDSPRGEYYHTNWTGQSGSTPAGRYSV